MDPSTKPATTAMMQPKTKKTRVRQGTALRAPEHDGFRRAACDSPHQGAFGNSVRATAQVAAPRIRSTSPHADVKTSSIGSEKKAIPNRKEVTLALDANKTGETATPTQRLAR
mmetsp:Transcript_70188/g.227203  ORF Transcript_70188/g.227203 Transcript_70188/m.227203 type:complete len:113 (+) Transcript_70188:1005-1343(+)